MASARRAKISPPARIVRDPAVCGGEPTIEGTRVPVRSIIIQWQFYRDLERVQSAFPRVNVPTIKEALAYYEAHREEIDRLIEENERAAYATE
jgi:uncharacterized protein (DUF433 family)